MKKKRQRRPKSGKTPMGSKHWFHATGFDSIDDIPTKSETPKRRAQKLDAWRARLNNAERQARAEWIAELRGAADDLDQVIERRGWRKQGRSWVKSGSKRVRVTGNDGKARTVREVFSIDHDPSNDPTAYAAYEAQQSIRRFCDRLDRADDDSAKALEDAYRAGYYTAEYRDRGKTRAQGGRKQSDHWPIVLKLVQDEYRRMTNDQENGEKPTALRVMWALKDKPGIRNVSSEGFEVETTSGERVPIKDTTFAAKFSRWYRAGSLIA